MTWIQIWWLDVLKVKEKNYQRKRFERKKRIDPELALIGLRTRPRSASGSSRGRVPPPRQTWRSFDTEILTSTPDRIYLFNGLNFSMTHALHFCHKTKQVICQKKSSTVLSDLDCKTVGLFLKISKEIGKARRKSFTRAELASFTRPRKKISLALCFQPRFRTFVQLFACTWTGKNMDCFAVYFWPKVWTPHPSSIKNSSSSSIFIYTRNRIILHGLPRNRV